MRLKNSLDWAQLRSDLFKLTESAPRSMRKDLAKMLGNITELVQQLSTAELYIRRGQSSQIARRDRLLEDIEAGIDQYEKWVMYAYLLKTSED
jgi:hypothetical protein